MGRDSSGGNTGEGGDRSYTGLVHGSTSDGSEVTASFGREGSSREGHTLISDGHKSTSEFYGSGGNKGHDHHDGKGGGEERGFFSW